MASDIHTYFGSSYATHLVVPRTLLQSMPPQWQEQFTALLTELDDAFDGTPRAEAYIVQAAEEKAAGDLTAAERRAVGLATDEHGVLSRTALLGEVTEADDDELVLVPVPDPVPHYNRGRTRLQPSTT